MLLTMTEYITRNTADAQERQACRKYLRSFIHNL